MQSHVYCVCHFLNLHPLILSSPYTLTSDTTKETLSSLANFQEEEGLKSFMAVLDTGAQFTILPVTWAGCCQKCRRLKKRTVGICRFPELESEIRWRRKQPKGLNPAVEGAAKGEKKPTYYSWCPHYSPFLHATFSSLHFHLGVSESFVAITVCPWCVLIRRHVLVEEKVPEFNW